ncbi:hypothetical protein KP509_36G045300 [Ceratopteris richardii]|uniref:Uncharacterized protein n=1 Tax=Ceratopteris richardii TaxID=49495 RepID=A0A8T2QBI9_CERRI|nr:hypothetical protein KP509_36G045300 [Ceratopteris richardii]
MTKRELAGVCSPPSCRTSGSVDRKPPSAQLLSSSDLVLPSKRHRLEERQRGRKTHDVAASVSRKILADRARFKDIVHQFTGYHYASTRDNAESQNGSERGGCSCSCHSHGCGHCCYRETLLKSISERLRNLEALTAFLLLRQGCIKQENCVSWVESSVFRSSAEKPLEEVMLRLRSER